MKNPNNPSEIELATFRLEAHCFNQTRRRDKTPKQK
jgi:hypothetical protein